MVYLSPLRSQNFAGYEKVRDIYLSGTHCPPAHHLRPRKVVPEVILGKSSMPFRKQIDSDCLYFAKTLWLESDEALNVQVRQDFLHKLKKNCSYIRGHLHFCSYRRGSHSSKWIGTWRFCSYKRGSLISASLISGVHCSAKAILRQ